ncbi:four-helix bundle copper-binding protein [Marinilactibacillus sp. XAAS-LB27]|uniref:four-helix bundle copper-binding protein n=1 Tax=Marinilactibacillus sp. XAAS-LB27 TaxID=3114538 RepID=UPI002E1783DC|nr:four-helix bundle copper-binding protein [Marinilactibacillus sp. XAAS-LB27]
MSQAVETLVSKVAACAKACNECFDACLKEDDVKMMANCIRTDRVCADMCGIVADFAYRESEIFPDLVAACAKACGICAEECENHEMQHCQDCAVACRECEKACKEYLGQ